MATYLDAAGPSRAPAVIVHPEQAMPKTWRIVASWEWRKQRGAWLAFTAPRVANWRSASSAELCHVVYRSTAKRYSQAGNMGLILARGSRSLVCNPWGDLFGNERPDSATWEQEAADREARAAHLGVVTRELRDRDRTALESEARTPAPATVESDEPVENLDLPIRPYNALKRNGVRTVGDLLRLSDSDILRMRNMGVVSLSEIDRALSGRGFKRQPSPRHSVATESTPAGADPEPRQSPSAAPPTHRRPNPALAAEAVWIGRQLDALVEDDRVHAKSALGTRWKGEGADLLNRRRAWAWYRWGSAAEGEWPRDKAGGFGYMAVPLPGSLELHLEGLNRLAHEELDA